MWNVSMYLFASRLTSDTVLLPQAPATYLAFAADAEYVQVYPDPLVYINAPQDAPVHPLVTLSLFYSEERQDLQTSTWTEEELNLHGGNYRKVESVGTVAASLTPGIEAAGYVPLLTSYDDARTDSLSAPLSFSDLNLLDELTEHFEEGAVAFRKGHREGYARAASCDVCHVSMSETFPSAGGADCAYKCDAGDSCKGSTYRLGEVYTPQGEYFDAQMRRAGEILMQYGDADVTYGDGLHMSLNYFCCYSQVDQDTIVSVLDAYPWPTVNVTFDRPVWRIDSDAETVKHASAIVLLDETSQRLMEGVVADVEDRIRARGIDVHTPRADQEPFHSTLAVVDGTTFPSNAALEAVNAAIPPGEWTGKGPLELTVPRF